MPKRGENIYLRKDGRWEGRYIKGYTPEGKPRFASIYGKQYGEVKKRLVLLKSALYQNDKAVVIYGNGSFRDWTEYWLEIFIRPYIKQSTYAGYRRNVNNHLYPLLGDMSIQKITANHIQDTADTLQKHLAPSTLQGVCRLLKSILQSAFEKGLIPSNPYQNIKMPKMKVRIPRVLTVTEQEILQKALLQTGELEYLLCLYTGLRVGELCALRWEDIDFESSILHVRRAAYRIPAENTKYHTQLVLGTPKSASSIRDIPLHPFLMRLLRERRTKMVSPGFLFPGSHGKCRDPRSMQERIHRLCEKLGISGVHMHTLRHTFATRCLEQSVGYEVLREFLGHSSAQITLRYYAHCTFQVKRESINRLEPAI